MAFFCGYEYTWVGAIKRIEIVDVIKTMDKFFQAQQVERGRGDEKYRRFITPKKSQDVG
jgi:hypothetical protein